MLLVPALLRPTFAYKRDLVLKHFTASQKNDYFFYEAKNEKLRLCLVF